MPTRGHRLVAWGWVLMLGLGLAAIAFAGEVAGRFGAGQVRVRPWMQSYNLTLGLLHLTVLALLALGTLRLPSGRAQKMALAAFALAALTVGAMLMFPLLWGGGPWAPEAVEVRALRVLVFAPSLLRTLGCAALGVAMLERAPRAASVIVALLSMDLVLVAWKWAQTPKAVMVCVHPFCVAPLGLLPWLMAGALFLWVGLSDNLGG